jgi:hypothetical protein
MFVDVFLTRTSSVRLSITLIHRWSRTDLDLGRGRQSALRGVVILFLVFLRSCFLLGVMGFRSEKQGKPSYLYKSGAMVDEETVKTDLDNCLSFFSMP